MMVLWTSEYGFNHLLNWILVVLHGLILFEQPWMLKGTLKEYLTGSMILHMNIPLPRSLWFED